MSQLTHCRTRNWWGRPTAAICAIAGAIGLVTPAAAETIQYAAWGSAEQVNSHEAVIAAFEHKYPELDADVVGQFHGWSGYHEKLLVEAAAGTLPDVMLISSAFFGSLAQHHAFLDLAPYVARDGVQEASLPPGSTAYLTRDGHLVGMPASGFAPTFWMMNYNKDLFDEAGLAYPKPGWTWDELLADARKITRDTTGDGKADIFGVDFADQDTVGVWLPLLQANCGKLWKDDWSGTALNSDAGRATFQFLKDLDSHYHVFSGWDVHYADGRVGMSISPSSNASNYLQSIKGFRTGVAPLPAGPCGESIPPPSGQVQVYAIAKNTPHPELAWRFVKFLVTEPESVEARTFAAPDSVAYKPLLQTYAKKIPAVLAPWWEVGQYDVNHQPAPRVPDKPMPAQKDWGPVVAQEVNAYYADKQSLNEALNHIQTKLDALVQHAQGPTAHNGD